ncbi:MAG: hypothetical protein HQ582_11320 [Planctomycetes bacterium]|nr:hypothetical protein [Planctomycetota bacterium]
MNRRFVLVFSLILLLGSSVGASTSQAIGISIAPQTINLQFQGEWVTVHADIPFAYVATGSVALDGFAADIETSDDRGYLVAKFDITKVSDYLRTFLDEGSATLTLTGGTTTGGDFSGSDTVRIIDKGGKRKK